MRETLACSWRSTYICSSLCRTAAAAHSIIFSMQHMLPHLVMKSALAELRGQERGWISDRLGTTSSSKAARKAQVDQ